MHNKELHFVYSTPHKIKVRIKWSIHLAWKAMKNELRALVSKGEKETSQNLKADGRILLKRVVTKIILDSDMNSTGLG